MAKWARDNVHLVRLRRTHSGRSQRDHCWLYHGEEDWPDFTGGTVGGLRCIPVVVECKREGEEPTEGQQRLLDALRADGWITLSCRSVAELGRELRAELVRRGLPCGRT